MMHAQHQSGVVMRKPKAEREQHVYHQYVSGRKSWCQMFSLLFLISMKKNNESYHAYVLSFAGFTSQSHSKRTNHPQITNQFLKVRLLHALP